MNRLFHSTSNSGHAERRIGPLAAVAIAAVEVEGRNGLGGCRDIHDMLQ